MSVGRELKPHFQTFEDSIKLVCNLCGTSDRWADHIPLDDIERHALDLGWTTEIVNPDSAFPVCSACDDKYPKNFPSNGANA